MFRTEFAVDGKWYTNALRFDNAEDAINEASSRFSRWIVPEAWRVVDDTFPMQQPYDGTGHRTLNGNPIPKD